MNIIASPIVAPNKASKNLFSQVDVFGRSALYYAARSGQQSRLVHLFRACVYTYKVSVCKRFRHNIQ